MQAQLFRGDYVGHWVKYLALMHNIFFEMTKSEGFKPRGVTRHFLGRVQNNKMWSFSCNLWGVKYYRIMSYMNFLSLTMVSNIVILLYSHIPVLALIMSVFHYYLTGKITNTSQREYEYATGIIEYRYMRSKNTRVWVRILSFCLLV